MTYRDINEELLSVSSAYKYHKPPELFVNVQELMQKLSQWFLEWWYKLFRVQEQGATNSRSMSDLLQLLIISAAILAAFIIGYVIYKRVSVQKSSVLAKRKGASAIEEILSWEGYERESTAQAALGEYRNASRSLYLSCLQLLDYKQIAAFAPAKTNYEYLYMLVKHQSVCEGFRSLSGRIEKIWFGQDSALEEDYLFCREVFSRLKSELNQEPEKNSDG